MKRTIVILLIAMLVLTACASGASEETASGSDGTLLVTAGDTQKSFTAADLQALGTTESTFSEVAYTGVTITTLLNELGVDPASASAFKGVASDGYTVNYDPSQMLKDNVVVAFALADGGSLTEEEGSFRMVMPDEEGKSNMRMLVEIQVIQ